MGDRAHPPTTLSRVDKPLVIVSELEQRPLEFCWGLPPIAKRDRPPNHPEIANDFCAVAIRVLGHGEWAVRSRRDLGKLDEVLGLAAVPECSISCTSLADPWTRSCAAPWSGSC